MVTTTLEMFREELLRTGAYKTPPDRMAAKPRTAGRLTTLGICWSVFTVFPRSSISEALGTLTPDKWAHFCFKVVQTSERYGIPVTAEGWNNRRDYKGPVVYLANHMSTLETILLPFMALTYGPFSTVVKQSLAHLPGLEKAAAHLGLIPIGRTNPREDLMTIFNVGGARIARGDSVLIFAQGRRLPVFRRKDWSSIGTKLAEKAGVPVVPIAVKTDLMPTRPDGRGWRKDFGTVDPTKDIRLACGPVLKGPSRETVKSSFDWIKAKLDSWGLPTED
ncbi:MAG: lysophospholipid acyltransferase family protein [Kiritimatiellia bacterium]